MRSRAIPAALLLAALSFFSASWFGMLLGGREVIRFRGLELVFGTRFSSTSPAAFLGTVRPQPGARIAAAAGVLALLLSLFRRRAATIAATTASTLAAAGLLATGVTFPTTIRERVSSVIEIKRGDGYHLAVLLFLAAAISLAFLMVRQPHSSDN